MLLALAPRTITGEALVTQMMLLCFAFRFPPQCSMLLHINMEVLYDEVEIAAAQRAGVNKNKSQLFCLVRVAAVVEIFHTEL